MKFLTTFFVLLTTLLTTLLTSSVFAQTEISKNTKVYSKTHGQKSESFPIYWTLTELKDFVYKINSNETEDFIKIDIKNSNISFLNSEKYKASISQDLAGDSLIVIYKDENEVYTKLVVFFSNQKLEGYKYHMFMKPTKKEIQRL